MTSAAFSKNRQSDWRLFDLVAVALLSVIAYCSLASIEHSPPGHDAGIFSASAYHLLNGRVLYRDVWDHKPPGIYFLNTLALSFAGADYSSIKLLERMFALCGTVLLYLLLRSLLLTPFTSAIFSILFIFHFYHHAVFQEGGNLTEEFAGIFLVAGILGAALSAASNGPRASLTALLSGLSISFAALTKEPFVLSTLPWALYVLFQRTKPHHRWVLRGGFFISGCLIPLMIFLAYLATREALWDWLGILNYNFEYSATVSSKTSFLERISGSLRQGYRRVPQRSMFTALFFSIGLVSVFYSKTGVAQRRLPWLLVMSLLFSILGTSLSGREWGHYYLQLVPCYIAISAIGFSAVARGLRYYLRHGRSALLILCAALMLYDAGEYNAFLRRFSSAQTAYEAGEITSYLKENARLGDALWAGSGVTAHYYLESRLLAPSKYIYVLDHLFIDTPEKSGKSRLKALNEEMQSKQPRFIILSRRQDAGITLIINGKLGRWIHEKYQVVATDNEGADLYELSAG